MAGLKLTLDVPAGDEWGRAARRVWINPAEVEIVYESVALKPTIRFRSGAEIEVREKLDTVAALVWSAPRDPRRVGVEKFGEEKGERG